MEKYIFITYIFIIGIVFGSFFNVCIFRIPNKESVSNPPSYCYKCNNRLIYLDLIPILSWILLKGKCRYCGQKISPRYPLIELLTGILFIIIYNVYGLNFITINYLVLISLLIIITFIDIDYYIIPDSIIILGSIFAVLFNLTNKGISIIDSVIGGVICSGGMLLLIILIELVVKKIILGSIFAVLFNLTNKGISIIDSVIGGVICSGGMLLLIILIELVVKKEVIGGGDIKLFFMIGLFLGLKLGLLTIILSIYVGAFYGIVTIIYSKIKKREYNSMIPYGPFISLGAIISVLCGTNIINWYIDLFI